MQHSFEKQFIHEIQYRLNENTPRIEKCLDQLEEEQIWLRPNASSNSIGNLITHLCGNITQYVISGLGGREDLRERDAEFSIRSGYSKSELLKKLNVVVIEASDIIEKLNLDELLRERVLQGFNISGTGILIHVVEHYSYHTGQIAFWTKLLLDRDLGFYDGLDLNIKNEI